jgi:hypothetical protein
VLHRVADALKKSVAKKGEKGLGEGGVEGIQNKRKK